MAAKSIKGITIEFDGDTSKLEKSLSALGSAANRTSKELKSINSGLKFDPHNVTLLSNKQEVLSQRIADSKEKVDKLKQAQNELANAKQQDPKKIRLVTTELAREEGRLKNLKKEYAEAAAAASKYTKISDKLSGVSKKLDGLTSKLKGGSAAASAIIGGSSKFAMDAETNLGKVNSILGLSGAEWERYEASLKQGANDIGKSYEEYADAAYQAISASVDAGDVTKFLAKSATLAKAGITDQSTATDLLTTVLNSYGKTLKDVDHINDALIKTQNDGKVTVNELGQYMGKVIPTASAYHVSLDELCASYALLTKNGVNVADSTTNLKSMFSELGKSGSISDKVLQNITGKSFPELIASGSTVGDVLGILNAEAKKNGKSIMSMFAKTNAQSAAYNLVKEGASGYNEELKKIQNSSGLAESAAAEMGNTTQGKLTKAINEAKNAFSDLGAGVLPILSSIAEKLTGPIKKFQALDDKTKEWIATALLVTAAASPVLSTLSKITSIGSSAAGAMAKLSGKLKAASALSSGGATIFGKLGAALGGISLPVAGVVAGIAALIGAFVYLWNTNDDFRENILETWGKIKETVSNFCQDIVDRINALGFDFEDITEVIKAAWDGLCSILAPIFEGAFSAISTVLSTVLGVITGILDTWGAVFSGDWSGVWEGICGIFSSIWDGVTGLFSNNLETLKGVADAVLGWFGTSWEEGWQSVKDFFTSLFSDLSSFWSETWGSIKENTSAAGSEIQESLSETWDGIVSFFTEKWNSIKESASNGVSPIQSSVSGGFTTLQSIVTNVWNRIQTSIITPLTNAKNKAVGIVTGLKSSVTNAFNGVLSTASSVFNRVKTAITTPVNAAKDTISKAVGKISGFFSGLKLKIPSISMPKLPHFSVSTKHFSKGPFDFNYPAGISVKWYAKAMQNGAILNSPTIFGMQNGKLLGAGEAGPEVVVGASSLSQLIQQSVNAAGNNIASAVATATRMGATAPGDIHLNVYLYPSGPKMGETIVRTYDTYKRRLG